MSERERFMRRLAVRRRRGLVDMRITLRPETEMTTEELFGQLNRIDDAVAAGRCVRHETWADIEPKPFSALL